LISVNSNIRYVDRAPLDVVRKRQMFAEKNIGKIAGKTHTTDAHRIQILSNRTFFTTT
jgi:hypothetical protein